MNSLLVDARPRASRSCVNGAIEPLWQVSERETCLEIET